MWAPVFPATNAKRLRGDHASKDKSMIRATHVHGQYRWTEAPADTIVLDFDDRHRRRMAMTGTRGLEFLLDLENAVALRGGDALVLEDGRLIEVVAAAEPLLEIRGADPLHLVRIAWHLGNRHLPTQIVGKGLRIRRDHVIEAMVKGLGARVVEIEAPFDPEGGAYAAAHAAHDHGHTGHDHAHDHHHDHAHGHGDHHHHHGDHHHHDEHCDHEHHHGDSHAHDHK
jgi:urease accessory protein